MSAYFQPPSQEIEIRGHRVPIRSQGDPVVIEETLRIVREGLRSADSKVRKELAPHHVVLVAYLELAEEYVRATRGLEAYQAEVAEKAQELMNYVGESDSR